MIYSITRFGIRFFIKKYPPDLLKKFSLGTTGQSRQSPHPLRLSYLISPKMEIKKRTEKNTISLFPYTQRSTINHSLTTRKTIQSRNSRQHPSMIVISGHLIRCILYILFGIAHSNTDTCPPPAFSRSFSLSPKAITCIRSIPSFCAEHGKTHTLVHTCSIKTPHCR